MIWRLLPFGSARETIAWAFGQRLFVNPTSQSCGEVEPGGLRTVRFEAANWSPRPIRFIGADVTCSCTSINELPFTLPPHNRRVIRVAVRARQEPGPIQERLRLFTEYDRRRTITLEVPGRVVHE
jgi:hypothetical protein